MFYYYLLQTGNHFLRNSSIPTYTQLLSLKMDLNKYQEIIRKLYFDKDSRRGLAKTFNWLVEEIGELSRAIRKGDPDKIREEFADCLAWLLSVATILGVDAEDAMTKYRNGCPKCHQAPCACHEKRTCDS